MRESVRPDSLAVGTPSSGKEGGDLRRYFEKREDIILYIMSSVCKLNDPWKRKECLRRLNKTVPNFKVFFGFKSNLCDNGIRPAKFHAYVQSLFKEDFCIIFFSPPFHLYFCCPAIKCVCTITRHCSVLFQTGVSIVTVYSIFPCLDSCVNKLLHSKVTRLHFSAKEIPLLTSLQIR